MALKIDWEEVKNSTLSTIHRFALTALVVLCAWGTALYLIWKGASLPNDENLIPKLLTVFLSLIAFSIALQLWAERSGKWTLAIKGTALFFTAFIAKIIFYDQSPVEWFALQIALIAGTFHLAVAVLPFLAYGTVHGFWRYNKFVLLRILTAGLYATTLQAGLTLALVATDNLLNINIPNEFFGTIAATIGIPFFTLYFLAGIPKDFIVFEADAPYPKGLKTFTQFALLPLVVIYLLILYAYIIKIIAKQEWPEGYISYLVFAYAIAGILAFLLLWPLRATGQSPWVQTFSRWFYFALIPLVAIEFLALAVRVQAYGLTEDRVVLAMLTAWLAFAVTVGIITKGHAIKVIPWSLAVAALIVSVGPLQAKWIGIASQKARLDSWLTSHGLIKANAWQLPYKGKTITYQDSEDFNSMIQYLGERKELTTFLTAYANTPKDWDTSLPKTENLSSYYNHQSAVSQLLHLPIGPPSNQSAQDIEYLNLEDWRANDPIQLQNYQSAYLDLDLEVDKNDTLQLGTGSQAITLHIPPVPSLLSLTADQQTVSFNLQHLIKALRTEKQNPTKESTNQPKPSLLPQRTLIAQTTHKKWMVLVQSITFKNDTITHVHLHLFHSPQKP